MPHPKGHVKLTGDTHLPDAESELALEEGRTGLEALAHERGRGGRMGGVRKAGMLQESETPAMAGASAQQPPPHASTRYPIANVNANASRDDATWRTATRVGLAFLGLCLFLRLLRR